MIFKRSSSNDEANRSFRKAAPYLNIGYTLAGGILLFAYIGYLIDEKTQQAPLFLVLGVFLGFGLGFYNMIKVLKNLDR